MTRSRTGRHAALSLAALAALLLAGCAQVPESAISPEACTPIESGSASRAVEVHRDGGALSVEFPKPLRAASTEVSVEGAGRGAALTEHGVFQGSLAVYDADSGKALLADGAFRVDQAGESAPITVSSLRAQMPGLAESLQCARAGEHLVAVMPAATFLGEQRAAGLADPTASVVAVVEVDRVFASSASGTVLAPQEGIPAVVTATTGRPGATMPQQAPPAVQRSALRVQGFGPVVGEGDRLTLHTSIFSWESGRELGSSWDATNIVLQVPAHAGPTDDGLYGATSALVGHPSGSQVIVIVPPDQAAKYGGPLGSSLVVTTTLVLVIDVLASDPAGGRS